MNVTAEFVHRSRASKILLTLLFTIAAVNAYSQTNFFPGYYLKTKTDTIRGFIEYRVDTKNSKECVFKATPDSKKVVLHSNDIVGYGIENKQWFESHTVAGRQNKEVSGFFRVLVRGKLSLLFFQSRFFVKTMDERVFDVSRTEENIEGKIKVDYVGLGMLKSLMLDCPAAMMFEMKKNFTRADYENMIVKYNECTGGPSQKEGQIETDAVISLGAQISSTLTSLDLGSPSFNATLNNDLHLKGGVFASLFIPKMNENLRLVVEASGGTFNNYSFFSSQNTNNDLFVKYSFLEVPVMLRLGKKFFIDAGLSSMLIINQNLTWRVETMQQNFVQTTNPPVDPLNALSIGFLFGLGFQRNLFNHAVRYSVRYNNVSASDNFHKQAINSVEFKVSYQLTHH